MTETMLGKPAEADDTALPYRLRERFLTTPEIALFRALQEMAGNRYVIFAKVALDDIFTIVRPNENVHYFNKLFRKHVDFLLCSPQSLRPQIGVELVRPSATKEPRGADLYIEDMFLTAGLAVVQIPSSDKYEIPVLVAQFQAAITKAKQIERKVADVGRDSVPMCPVCGKMMVLRTRRSKSEADQLYYGCIDNPTCPGTSALK